ncbi:MAG: prolipoprotein diacylglyceryl transferase [Candidatus Pelagibacter sp. TMED253]|nr:MAG: prolipoprotein diacylglyceryl transferase [Candidatus Pelagibacter sp. TMED253]|tara:strand:- start:1939 stop:2724 length:786 start_codon:yes stop_codon:yes gene_type:complete
MYTHNLDPVLFNFGFFVIRWYSLAYIFGILIGWWLGKKIILKKIQSINFKFDIKEFDNLITYIIISILIGGRLGYILFYNFEYYLSNPLNIVKIWEGGMSFHGALLGIIFATYWFSIKKNIMTFFLLDIIACVAPIGIFFGRIANFINGELVGKTTDIFWGVVFPNVDNFSRHPSQLYEAFLEGLVLLIIMNLILFRKNYKTGTCSYMFLILYGVFRIFSEFFREPDAQVGYLFNLISMGTMLSVFMILGGIIIFLKKNDI